MFRAGFTLIEMSVVLVIIGLIIGGILVGRDLIAASEVRAQVAQIEKYNSAVNTFMSKYGGVPGDLNVPLATQFGFTVGAGFDGGTVGHRNGDGLIEGASVAFLSQGMCETAQFWMDLSTPGLIDGEFPATGAAPIQCVSSNAIVMSSTTAGNYFPVAKIGHGNFIYVYTSGGANWYGVSAITSNNIFGIMYSTPSIPVIQAYNIDKKVDDGLPTTGQIVANYINNNTVTIQPAKAQTTDSPTSCYNTTNNVYSISASANQGAGLNCALSFKFQ
jgi:prepilin-type N-terminal cleavage/methylation domain-containing protein